MWNDCAPGEKLLTKGEVAQLCRVEIRTVNRWVAAGKIRPYRTPGGRLLFRNNDVLTTADRWQDRVVQGGRDPARVRKRR
jgi:excisionase family DNA binding protein